MSQVILSTNLRIAREYFGYSIDQIADYLHDPNYSMYETDNVCNQVSVYTLERLADLYGMHGYKLFEEEFKPESVTIVPGVNYSNMSTEDLDTIARFHSLILEYINMSNI